MEKKIVNDKVKDKENKNWTATSRLFRGLNDFKSTGITLKTGCLELHFKAKHSVDNIIEFSDVSQSIHKDSFLM